MIHRMLSHHVIDEAELDSQAELMLRQLLAVSFPGYPDRAYYKQLPDRRVLAWDGQTLVGHVAIDRRVMALAGQPIRTLGLIDVCVAPGYRSRGIASALLAEAERLGRSWRCQFAVLFADDPRVYEASGYCYADNPCIWLRIDEHQTLGIAHEALPSALMIKALGAEPWRPGHLDLLGYLF
jgi:GNAT superfamily N-acetyltransferase